MENRNVNGDFFYKYVCIWFGKGVSLEFGGDWGRGPRSRGYCFDGPTKDCRQINVFFLLFFLGRGALGIGGPHFMTNVLKIEESYR